LKVSNDKIETPLPKPLNAPLNANTMTTTTIKQLEKAENKYISSDDELASLQENIKDKMGTVQSTITEEKIIKEKVDINKIKALVTSIKSEQKSDEAQNFENLIGMLDQLERGEANVLEEKSEKLENKPDIEMMRTLVKSIVQEQKEHEVKDLITMLSELEKEKVEVKEEAREPLISEGVDIQKIKALVRSISAVQKGDEVQNFENLLTMLDQLERGEANILEHENSKLEIAESDIKKIKNLVSSITEEQNEDQVNDLISMLDQLEKEKAEIKEEIKAPLIEKGVDIQKIRALVTSISSEQKNDVVQNFENLVNMLDQLERGEANILEHENAKLDIAESDIKKIKNLVSSITEEQKGDQVNDLISILDQLEKEKAEIKEEIKAPLIEGVDIQKIRALVTSISSEQKSDEISAFENLESMLDQLEKGEAKILEHENAKLEKATSNIKKIKTLVTSIVEEQTGDEVNNLISLLDQLEKETLEVREEQTQPLISDGVDIQKIKALVTSISSEQKGDEVQSFENLLTMLDQLERGEANILEHENAKLDKANAEIKKIKTLVRSIVEEQNSDEVNSLMSMIDQLEKERAEMSEELEQNIEIGTVSKEQQIQVQTKEVSTTKKQGINEEVKVETIKPTFVSKPKSIIDLVEGMPLIIEAEVKALPEPRVLLLRNKKQIIDYEEFGCSYNIYAEGDITTISYEIYEAEKNKHDGMYHINVSNEKGETVCGIQVNVKGNENKQN
jgi:hypothetical protein